MYDSHNRQINYLRVSVTDRCNFRCAYCMPPEGVKLHNHSDILSYEELFRVVRVVSQHGVSKVRLTGGEPLVRRGIISFIRNIASLPTITDISLTTNGALLADMVAKLKAAGLNRVNISLDTIDADQFRTITCGGNISETLRGMEAALSAGLAPVKINVVLTSIFTERDLSYFVDLIHQRPVSVRFIEYMPVGDSQVKAGPGVEDIKGMIHNMGRGELVPTRSIHGNGPAKYFYLPQAKGTLGFITPISEHFCSECNRIRLTADGKFKPCLLSNKEIDIKAALRSGADDDEIAAIFYSTIGHKPEGHTLITDGDQTQFFRKMSQIGG